ncbi:MAG: hypothetical protein HY699_22340 [Deltaproteobacteria bacterium]|nr:hypothetical protein [Deltaproteobacteria bacterium]
MTLRYARSIAEGDGFVFSPGERVLGTTTPLFALILAGLHYLTSADLIWLAYGIAVGAHVAVAPLVAGMGGQSERPLAPRSAICDRQARLPVRAGAAGGGGELLVHVAERRLRLAAHAKCSGEYAAEFVLVAQIPNGGGATFVCANRARGSAASVPPQSCLFPTVPPNPAPSGIDDPCLPRILVAPPNAKGARQICG